MTDSVKVEGLRELRANLLKLTDRVQKNVLNRSVNAGARIIRDQARQNAPVEEGKLKRNIITAKRRAPRGAANYVVAVRGISPQGNSDNSMKASDPKNAFYGRFVEFGTSKWPGGKPFLTPAFESKKRDAVEAIKRALGEGIEKEAKKEGVRL